MWHEYHRDAAILFVGCTIVFLFCRTWLDRSHRRSSASSSGKAQQEPLSKVVRSMVRVSVSTDGNSNDACTSHTNAVYLTRFHVDAFKALLLHVVYGCVTYFRDITNIYYLAVSVMLLLEYRDARALTNAMVLFAFDLLSMANHVWSVSGLLLRQHRTNRQPTTRLVRRHIFAASDTGGAEEALVEESILTSQLRRGDVIRILAGRVVPCDVLLFSTDKGTTGVQMQELQLAGEDVVVGKSCISGDVLRDTIHVRVQPQADEGVVEVTGNTTTQTFVYNSSNLVFRGTQVMDRSALGVVIETGNDCAIYRLTHDQHKPPTAIQKQTMHVCINNLYLMMLLASSMALLLHARSGLDPGLLLVWPLLRKMLLLFNTLVPLSHQFFFSEGSRLLSRRIERESSGVSINRNGVMAFQHHDPHFIVTDKTGTVTLNQLELHSWWRQPMGGPGGKNGSDWEQVLEPGAIEHIYDRASLLAQVLACSEIQPHSTTGQLLKSDVVEEALIRTTLDKTGTCLISNQARGSITVVDRVSKKCLHWQRRFITPFDFDLGVKLSVVQAVETGQWRLHVQGTPEAIQAYATPTDASAFATLLYQAEQQGISNVHNAYRRMIAYGECDIDENQVSQLQYAASNEVRRGLIGQCLSHLSLYVFLDRIVPGVRDSMLQLMQDQGRCIVLLTGDKASSAKEIGCTIGLLDPKKHLRVVETVKQLETAATRIESVGGLLLDGRLLQERVTSGRTEVLHALFSMIEKRPKNRRRSLVVFRASPMAKQMLVSLLQHWYTGQSVVMVGDGCNDMSALVQADISIAVSHGDENRNVQDMADVVVGDWNQLVPLLKSCAAKRRMILEVSSWVMQKHFTTAATLLTMLLVSDLTLLRDPSHPFVMNIFNASAFVAMCAYCSWTKHEVSVRHNNCFDGIGDRFSRRMFVGAVGGIVQTLLAFTLVFDVHTQAETGIHCLIVIQAFQLVTQLLLQGRFSPYQREQGHND